MHLKLFTVSFALISLIGPCNTSFLDSIPLVAQIKSIVQAVSGDEEGARQTQENFVDQAPLVSQIKSLVQAASGDSEGALQTQEKFLHEFVEPVVDNTPVVGHIKGSIHIAAGDTERGEQILKSATSSTVAALGGIVAGPAGAVVAGAASDGIITGIDSAVSQEYKPFGVVEYASEIDKKSPGEHFDTWIAVGAPKVLKTVGKSMDNIIDRELTSNVGKF